mmetsp:Transcript_20478/g.50900  ORF Transcript_20478/g.50900 Transcript_20478/m.50900 type:complete len:314 (+) Transcript_20478:768-1709(+)
MTSNPLFIIVALSRVILAPMSQLGWVVALACTARGSSWHILKSSSLDKSRKAPPEAVRMTRRKPPSGTPCRHWKMALCSLSAGSMLMPCSLTRGLMTGPPLMSVSLFARAMSFFNLIASMVGWSPAAPTIPVTTVSAESIVEHARIPSSPCMIVGMLDIPADSRFDLSSAAASAVAIETTFGVYFRTCSVMSFELVPAERASTTKLSGQASTISRVWVPIDPVDPRRESRFWKVAPSNDFESVSFRDSALFTGAEGSIHPSPVPALPDTTSSCVAEADDETGAKPDAVGAADRKRARAREKFMLMELVSSKSM